ncbi:MAG: phosphate acyltransferase PlsX [Clostridia bacterium]
MKVVLDCLGGDNAPVEMVKGALLALKENSTLKLVLCGDQEEIKKILAENGNTFSDRIEIVHAPDKIVNNESPTEAIKKKTNSSLVVAFNCMKADEEIVGLVSAGSTGAVLTGSFLKVGRIKGVSRPALSPLMPTKKNGKVLLVDCGANMDCKPINLCHFAVMGSEFMKIVCGVKNPRVALLNVGVEDKKGNELCSQVFPMLKKLDINFVGNMEARDFCSGDYDVIVTDAFAGNVLLKGAEGTFSLINSELKKSIKSNPISLLGGLLCKGAFKKLKNKFNLTNQGGSPFIGVKKIIIKSHGSSEANSIKISIFQALDMAEKNYNQAIEEAIAKMPVLEEEATV